MTSAILFLLPALVAGRSESLESANQLGVNPFKVCIDDSDCSGLEGKYACFQGHIYTHIYSSYTYITVGISWNYNKLNNRQTSICWSKIVGIKEKIPINTGFYVVCTFMWNLD